MRNIDDKDIVDALKKLPHVKDNRSKEDIYENISNQVRKKSLDKRKRFVPYFTAAAVFLLFLGIFMYGNFAYDEQMSMEMNVESSQGETFITSEESYDGDESGVAELDTVERADLALIDNKSNPTVIQNLLLDEKLIHYTLNDNFNEFIIPLASIVTGEKEQGYDLERIKEIIESKATLPEHFVLENLNSLEQKASYMVYRDEYYVIIPQGDDTTIRDALKSMQGPSPHPDIEPVMDSTLSFKVNESNQLLIFEIEGKSIRAEDITSSMIDAILLTAKSYGFSEVYFKYMPINGIGNYQFDGPIQVPVAANPIEDSKGD